VSRRAALALAALATAAPAAPAAAAAVQTPCERAPEPARWSDAGSPDRGRTPTTIAVHRGAAELAPENTMPAYEYAIAYEAEMIEVDVQQLRDGRFVSFHDPTVDRKTDGSGRIADMSWEEARRLNAADNDDWRGSEYDPARIPSLEEVLELARDTGTGVYFDIKESVTNLPALAEVAGRYGVVERSAFLTYDPLRGEVLRAADPRIELMLSKPEQLTSPAALFAFSERYRWFGSELAGYDAEQIAAIHDGCALAIPNVYGGDVTGSERGDLLHALALGADAAQVNRPEVAAAALGEPVATEIRVERRLRPGRGGDAVACLRSARHGFGVPEKTLLYRGGHARTRRGGCARLEGVSRWGGQVAFAGDDSARPSRALLRARRRGR
jgi:glycerophosphoryl diester phosphodiesterase